MKRTLIIVTVLLLLCIAGAAIVYKVYGGTHYDRRVVAQAALLGATTQLKLYRRLNGFFPTSEQGLDALVVPPTSSPIPEHWMQLVYPDSLIDPWGHRFQYRLRDSQSFDLFSLGPDGIESHDDVRVSQ